MLAAIESQNHDYKQRIRVEDLRFQLVPLASLDLGHLTAGRVVFVGIMGLRVLQAYCAVLP